MRIFEIEPGEKRKVQGSWMVTQDQHFDNVWTKLIEPKCSEALSIYKSSKRILYRGAKNNPPIYRGRSLDERRPTDSNSTLTMFFDKMLADNGMLALRKNSVFATSSWSHASNFGTVYAFFPVNGFKFTYTNENDIVLDNWENFIDNKLNFNLNQKFINALSNQNQTVNWETHWLRTGIESVPTVNKLPAAIRQLKELLPDDPEVQKLSVLGLINPQAFAAKFQPSNTNLGYALENSLEVYVQGQYYAIEHSMYKDNINKKLGR